MSGSIMGSADPFQVPAVAVAADAESEAVSGAEAAVVEAEAASRDANPQYVLPLVVRIERGAPPQRTDALETAARAVLVFLADPRSSEADGEWTPLVEAWTDGRIRKVVRRARGAEWRRAEALAGITVRGGGGAGGAGGGGASAGGSGAAGDGDGDGDGDGGGGGGGDGGGGGGGEGSEPAQVRVFPPVPLDGWPKDLARLQVSGTDLVDAEPPAPVEPGSQPVLWLNPELEMTAGKAMAQVGHAAQLAWWRLSDAQRKSWADEGFRLAVRVASRAVWTELVGSGRPVVRDAGFTEIAPGSCTVVADLPVLGG